MGIWHKYSWLAYLAVFLGVCGHASSEFFSVVTGLNRPELSVWSFLMGGSFPRIREIYWSPFAKTARAWSGCR